MAKYNPVKIINLYAPKFGLDPKAVRAFALTQGGLHFGAVGDNGSSFGPFQMHLGGAIPSHMNAAQARKFANSPRGLIYGMRQMATVGKAKGLKGNAAISAIINNWGRGAFNARDIAKAIGYYNQLPDLPTGGQVSLRPAGKMPKAPKKAQSDFQELGLILALSSLGSSSYGSSGSGFDMASILPLLFSDSQKQQMPKVGKVPPVKLGSGLPLTGGGGKIPSLSNPRAFLGAPSTGPQSRVPRKAPLEMFYAIKEAQKMGLRVGENLYVGPVNYSVHVAHSFHKLTYKLPNGKSVSRAADISGTPAQMAQFYKWAKGFYGPRLTELFYDPLGGIKYGNEIGAIGGHSDHVHIAF